MYKNILTVVLFLSVFFLLAAGAFAGVNSYKQISNGKAYMIQPDESSKSNQAKHELKYVFNGKVWMYQYGVK